jgi:hypothetical protein
MIQKNQLYRHFKGNIYIVVDFAKNSDNEDVVIYRNINEEQLWVRTLQEFTSMVIYNEVTVPRFTLLKDSQ